MKSKLNFENLSDPLFKQIGKGKMYKIKGGYTVTFTGCSDTKTMYGSDASCSDQCCTDV